MKVLVVSRLNEYVELFENKNIPFVFADVAKAIELIEKGEEIFDVYFGEPIPLSIVLKKTKNKWLRWVHSTYAGVDAICKVQGEQKYILTRISETSAPMMAEYVFEYVLEYCNRKHSIVAENAQKERITTFDWELQKMNFLILGTGCIGEGVAKAANGFGVKNIWGYNKSGRKPFYFTKIIQKGELLAHVAKANVIVNILPATPETQNFMDEEFFSYVSQNCILIIAGRGNSYDLTVLKQKLLRNEIAKAVVDVFPVEPLSPEDEIWSIPNLEITPHCAAACIPEVIVDVFERNVSHYLKDEQLNGVVDFTKGY